MEINLFAVVRNRNTGEQRFVEDLVKFCAAKPQELIGKELFVLRNLSRGKGVGFFEGTGFYPDFLLWITEKDKQRLVFVEPHGLLRDDHPRVNPKVNLHKRLKAAMASSLKNLRQRDLSVDSFVISVTPYDEIRTRIVDEAGPWSRKQFADAHILFFGGLEYLATIVSE